MEIFFDVLQNPSVNHIVQSHPWLGNPWLINTIVIFLGLGLLTIIGLSLVYVDEYASSSFNFSFFREKKQIIGIATAGIVPCIIGGTRLLVHPHDILSIALIAIANVIILYLFYQNITKTNLFYGALGTLFCVVMLFLIELVVFKLSMIALVILYHWTVAIVSFLYNGIVGIVSAIYYGIISFFQWLFKIILWGLGIALFCWFASLSDNPGKSSDREYRRRREQERYQQEQKRYQQEQNDIATRKYFDDLRDEEHKREEQRRQDQERRWREEEERRRREEQERIKRWGH